MVDDRAKRRRLRSEREGECDQMSDDRTPAHDPATAAVAGEDETATAPADAPAAVERPSAEAVLEESAQRAACAAARRST